MTWPNTRWPVNPWPANPWPQVGASDPDATLLFARMATQPSTTRKHAIASTIIALKAAGVWSRLDALYVMAAHTAQAAQLNWKSTSFNLTPMLSPVFGADVGYKGDGLASWLDTGMNPSTAVGANFVQNSASFGVWLVDATKNTGQNIAGLWSASTGVQIVAPNAQGQAQYRINQAGAIVAPTVITDGTGLFAVNRTDANNVQMYLHGTVFNSNSATASIAPINGTFGFGKLGSTGAFYGSVTMAAGFIGGSLTDVQHAALNSAISAYLASVSAITIAANFATTSQTYKGGYIEIQPDSYNGGTSTPAIDGTTDIWGFPYSLTAPEQARLKALVMPGGGKGLQLLRFPLGFGYRGFRNIDGTTGLAKNIGERFSGQNAAISALIANVVADGGGLAPEYWCPAPYWMTSSSYSGTNSVTNKFWAGAAYARTVQLSSIKGTDLTQYNAQIAALTDAMLNDFEYLHQNVGPVRMYGLQNEPSVGNAAYGSNIYTDTMYSDVLVALVPKVKASTILATYGGVANVPKLHLTSDQSISYGTAYQQGHPTEISSYTYHNIQLIADDADWIKTAIPQLRGSLPSYWANEVEYFSAAPSSAFQCANNMLRDVNNLVYGNAPNIMPIIHILKQIGQNSATSNTLGYGLLKARLPAPYGQDPSTPGDTDPTIGFGNFDIVPENYNSFLFISDNVPVGAVRVGGIPVLPRGVGFAAFTNAGKTIILIANRNATPVAIYVPLTGAKTLNGKQYGFNQSGVALTPQTSAVLSITIPAYSGQAWAE
ncbi:MAG: hypothetical protein JWP38_3729 [Herbaspirillum sp.]|nr:hypothetical protein [Herbaspirillum sp.]